MGKLLIYGATGYSGCLIAERACQIGLNVVLAGRDAARTRQLAEALGLPWRAFGLDEPRQIDAMLGDIGVVLHAAGPFIATAAPMMQACLRTRKHYLDIAGELPAFRLAERNDKPARQAGIMLMPGAGFVVATSDCLAAHLAGRLPQARYLRLGTEAESVGRGTMRSMLEMVSQTVTIRRAGTLAQVPVGHLHHEFDFGRGPQRGTAVSAADVLTAWHTTGIPNIEAYARFDPLAACGYQLSSWFAEPLRLPPLKSLVSSLIAGFPEGPTPAQRATGRLTIVGEAEDQWRRTVRSRLVTPDGYGTTPGIALGIAARVLAGDFRPGFRTPAGTYGTDLVLALDGFRLEDLDDTPTPTASRSAQMSGPAP